MNDTSPHLAGSGRALVRRRSERSTLSTLDRLQAIQLAKSHVIYVRLLQAIQIRERVAAIVDELRVLDGHDVDLPLTLAEGLPEEIEVAT